MIAANGHGKLTGRKVLSNAPTLRDAFRWITDLKGW